MELSKILLEYRLEIEDEPIFLNYLLSTNHDHLPTQFDSV